MSMPTDLWGVWGGRPPGGWCSFRSTHASADRRPENAPTGYGYVGSLAEAEAGRAALVLVKDFDENRAQNTYEIVPFDATREPVADETSIPTDAQAAFLRELARTGDYNEAVAGALGRQALPATRNAVHDRGWTFSYKPDPTVPRANYFGHALVTPAGRRALARYEGGSMSAPVSPRGKVLAWSGYEALEKSRRVPILTVELASKWYALYVVDAEGRVEEITFGELATVNGPGAPYCDHVPNPDRVRLLAEARGWYVDDLAEELVVGRWQLEVERNER